MGEADKAPGIMQVYGSRISYYTGKFETYLRYRSIPYAGIVRATGVEEVISGA